MQSLLTNAHLILRDRLIDSGWLAIDQGRISGYGEMPVPREYAYLTPQDLGGAFLMPGIVDLHCDTIEKMIQPRPGVMLSTDIGLQVTDRLLVSSGVTCEFHSLSLDDAEFGVRNDEFIHEFIQHITQSNATTVRHLVHARVEISSVRGTQSLSQILGEPCVRLVSIMDHSPGQGQYATDEAFRYYVAKTTGRNDAEIDEIIAHKNNQREFIAERIQYVVDVCQHHRIPVATHDDDTVAKITEWQRHGIQIREFPTTMEAAVAAHAAGMHVGMGAPNVLRGKSSSGNLSASDAIVAGVVDWLCADYYPAALLPAAFRIADQQLMGLPDAIALITTNPARAVGMGDSIGDIAVGLHADLCVVRLDAGTAIVTQVFVDGCSVYAIAPAYQTL